MNIYPSTGRNININMFTKLPTAISNNPQLTVKSSLEAFGPSKELHVVVVQKEEFQLEYERFKKKTAEKPTIRKSRSVPFNTMVTKGAYIKNEGTRVGNRSPALSSFRIKNEPGVQFSPPRRIKSEMDLSMHNKLHQAADTKRTFFQRGSISPHETEQKGMAHHL